MTANYKQLFPTFRRKYLFVKTALQRLSFNKRPVLALNLGCGEGDYDLMISNYVSELISCDLNENDIAFAKSVNQKKEITYKIENAEKLSFPDNYFDLILSIDVYEHVNDPEKMVAEMARVLKPGGKILITFPTKDFPISYDPVNYFLQKRGKKLSMGAYSYGHHYLPERKIFEDRANSKGLRVSEKQGLTHFLASIPELYWVGFLQRIFKDNSGNVARTNEKKIKLRPSYKEPFLSFITDGILRMDNFLFSKSKKAVVTGYILTKQ